MMNNTKNTPPAEFLEEYTAVLKLVSELLTTESDYALELFEPAARRILYEKHRRNRDLSEDDSSRLCYAKLTSLYSQDPAKDHELLAKAYYNEGLIPKALSAIEDAIEEDSMNADYYRLKSTFLEQLERFREAAFSFENALSLQSHRCLEDNLKLAYLYENSDKLDEAISIVENVIKENSLDYDVMRLKASLLERSGRMKEAYETINQLHSLLPNEIWAVEDYRRIKKKYFKSKLIFWKK